MPNHVIDAQEGSVAILAMHKAELPALMASWAERTRAWILSTGFAAEPGSICLVPGDDGRLDSVLFGLPAEPEPWAFAALPAKLPPGLYHLGRSPAPDLARRWALEWSLATYAFDRYKSRPGRDWPRLVWPDGIDRGWVERTDEAIRLVRDLINTPAADLGPAELAGAAEALASRFGATCRVIVGDGLLAENYPAIHAVGRGAAAHRRPRLIDLNWGEVSAPRVTVVGKGVCFDSGGLDLKPSAGMKLMKKDMGGAAHALGLALMIMAAGLKVRLRVLIPAVENSVSGDAMRPLDVLATRKGLSVEVGNTDAEGRLILCDALAEASRDAPALLIDLATLTGAARTALGPDLAALFANDDALAADLLAAGEAEGEPMWRLPLHQPYRRMLDSKVADIANVSDSPHAGAITAALFLKEFVADGIAWAHFDIMAWNAGTRPGRPEGGEAMALRALYRVVAERFGR